ncbi:putative uncharacterized protein [Mycoplasma sp. CAG:776]|nr:putative uncharacterized protein [Mycoplasma sp. CAG:776]
MLFLEYPKCSTCKKAKKFLDENNISYKDRHIVLNNPTKEELKEWITKSGRDIKTFFNTSGNLYKELNLKDKLNTMSEEEKLELLASNGMLVKRPLLIKDDIILSGFKVELWSELLK